MTEWHFCGISTIEYLGHLISDLAERIKQVAVIGHKASCDHEIAKRIHGRDLRLRRDADQHLAVRQVLRLVRDQQKFGTHLRDRAIGGLIGSLVQTVTEVYVQEESFSVSAACFTIAA